jgi:ribonuclease HI
VLKINTDGVFRLNERVGGWGFVIRDRDKQQKIASHNQSYLYMSISEQPAKLTKYFWITTFSSSN